MIRSTRSITLVLISAGLAALGFGLWEHGGTSSATTQPSGGSSGYHSWYGRAFGGSSGGSSATSGTSRGGFGSTGHSVSS